MEGKTNLPDTWVTSEIKEIGDVVSGGTPATKEATYWGDGVNWISPADLTGYTKKYIARGAKSITELGLKKSSAKLMPAGSVHFSSRAPIGYVAISSEPISTNQGFKSIVPANGIFNEYLYYYLKSAKQLAESQATGTTFKELSGTAFSKLPLPVPPTNEQKRIVAKIEELFSELDKGVESLKHAQEQLKIYRQSILKHAFDGKLTAKWREDNNLSFDWQTKTIKELTTINPKHKDVDDACEISFVPMGALNQETAKIDEHEYRKFGDVKKGYTHFAENDILFAKITPCMENGKNGIAKGLKNGLACGSTEFFVFRCNDELLPEYLLLKFRDTLFRRLAEANMTGAVGQRRVPKGWIEKVEINLPPITEQQKIIEEISILNDEIYHIEQDISDNLKRADVLRQAILKKAFSGKLVDQDPNDEPASVLLARIAEEKQQAKPAKRTKKKVNNA